MKPIITVIAVAGLFSMTACNRAATQEREAAIRQHTIDSMNTEVAKRNAIDSMNNLNALQNRNLPVIITPAQPAVQPTRYVGHTSGHYSGRSSGNTVVYEQAPAPVPAHKKGWSNKAKGAVIGGGAGAITGAIIDHKNRGVGALVGGILGAGAGTGVGAIVDKKHGR